MHSSLGLQRNLREPGEDDQGRLYKEMRLVSIGNFTSFTIATEDIAVSFPATGERALAATGKQ